MSAQIAQGVRDEAYDLYEGEVASLGLVERLWGIEGAHIEMSTCSGHHVSGLLTQVTPAFVVIEEGRQWVIPLSRIGSVSTLGRAKISSSALTSRLGLPHALRSLAHARERIRAEVIGHGGCSGYIVRVGKDHVDIYTDTRRTITIPLHALDCVHTA